jgi:hypothetical protein
MLLREHREQECTPISISAAAGRLTRTAIRWSYVELSARQSHHTTESLMSAHHVELPAHQCMCKLAKGIDDG